MTARRPVRRNALITPNLRSRAPSLPLASSSATVTADIPSPVDRFHPADPNARDLHPFPPNRIPKFNLFSLDELIAMVTCQRDVYNEKYAEMEKRRLALRQVNKYKEWSHDDKVEYAYLKAYKDLLWDKKNFWESVYARGINPYGRFPFSPSTRSKSFSLQSCTKESKREKCKG